MLLCEHVYCVAVTFKMTKWVGQWIFIKFCIKLEHSSTETAQMIEKATGMGNCDWQLHHNNTPALVLRLMQRFFAKCQITQVTQPPYSPDLVPCDSWLFPKLKSPLKGKRFQTVDEIQENMTGQLTVIGRTVWGPKVLTWKRTEASLSYVQCFSYFVSSSINVSFFHFMWMDTFRTDLIMSVIFHNYISKLSILWWVWCHMATVVWRW